MSDTKKYYWLKLKRDFFKRHDITVIESMQNGDKYLLFYMKLLVEGIDHEGALRFSDTVPYNDAMLAAITRTDIDIVRSAVKIFQQFGMMDLLDDGTLFMKQVETMIGDETEWAEKKRLYREKQKLIETAEGQKRTMSDKSKRLEIELDKDIEKDTRETPDKPAATSKPKRAKKEFMSPTQEEVTDYILEKQLVIDPYKFIDWYNKTDWKDNQGNQIKNWKNKAINWDSREKEKNPDAVPYSKTPIPEKRIQREAKKCPKCGGDIRGSACVECYTNYDYQGNEI